MKRKGKMLFIRATLLMGLLVLLGSGTAGAQNAGMHRPAGSPYLDGQLPTAQKHEKAPLLGRGGEITINVYASSAPNAYGSPSWAGYVTKALYALENELAVNGDRSTDPTGYERAPELVNAGEIAVTSFHSWRGIVDPPLPFNNEYGNRMHFGLHAYGNGTTQFTLEDLTFAIHSSDPNDTLIFEGDFIGYSYSSTRYGIDWGTNRVKGGGDDTVYTSGNGTTLVDEIVYVGVGNAWWPGGDDPNPSNPDEGKQGAMDAYLAWVAAQGPVSVTCTYSILNDTGSDTVGIVAAELSLVADEECYEPGDTMIVEARLNSTLPIVAGEFAFLYDFDALTFTGVEPGGNPWTWDFEGHYESSGIGQICAYAVGLDPENPGTPTTSGPMVRLIFTVNDADQCAVSGLVAFDPNPPTACIPTELVGSPLNFLNRAIGNLALYDLGPIYVDDEAPVIEDIPDDILEIIIDSDECEADIYWCPPTADDNCDVVEFTSNYEPGDVFPVGTTQVCYTAKDYCGNTTTECFTVTVLDGQSPVFTSCPDDITQCTDPGVCTAVVTWQTPAAWDNCGIQSLTSNYPSGHTFPLGTTRVIYTAVDIYDNSATCEFDVTIEDCEDPTIACPNDVVVCTGTGVCFATNVTLGNPSVSDNCDVALNVTNNAPQEFPWGDTIVTWTACDDADNCSTCEQKVTVEDCEPPTIFCPPDFQMECCGKMHFDQLPDPYGWDVNATSPKVIADDWRCMDTGPVQFIHFWGSWKDDEIGTITSFHLSIHADIPDPDGPGPLYSMPGQELWSFQAYDFAIVPIDPPSMQGWYDPNITDPNTPAYIPNNHQHYFRYSIQIPECFWFEQVEGTIYWLDVSANVSEQDKFWGWKTSIRHFNDDAVWGDFSEPMWQELRDPTEESLDMAFRIASHTFASPGAPSVADNCDTELEVWYTDSYTPGVCPQQYDITRTWWVRDDAGLTNSCQQIARVRDTTEPSITCPPDVTGVAADTDKCYATNVDLGTPIVTDNCDLNPTWSNDAPDQFPVGTTTVTWTARDCAGNWDTCEQSVTVVDAEDPTITCPHDWTVDLDVYCYGLIPDLTGVVTVIDNCTPVGDLTISQNPPADTQYFGIQTVNVTITVEDEAGNDYDCVVLVYFVDVTPPTITCPPDVGPIDADDYVCYATNVYLGTPATSDNCGVAGVSNDAPTQFPVGTTVVTWTVTDYGGNTATCTQNVTVTEDEPPVIHNCPSNIVVGNDLGMCSAQVWWTEPTATDNCAIQSFTKTHAPGSVFPVGTTTVRYTATDTSGNWRRCTFTVTVNDTEKPTITCPENIETITDLDCQGAYVTVPPPAVADNCGVQSVVNDYTDNANASGDYPCGTTAVTWTVTDIYGNTETCVQLVTVDCDVRFLVTVEILGLENPVTRCVTFTLNGMCGSNSIKVNVEFDTEAPNVGYGGVAEFWVPCYAEFDCITAEDTVHTLLSRTTPQNAGDHWEASFTGDPFNGGKALIPGDIKPDGRVNALDFGVFLNQWDVTPPPGLDPDTLCTFSGFHADLTGDGYVSYDDFLYLSDPLIWQSIGWPDCCSTTPPRLVGEQDSWTIKELLDMGLPELALADLNRDDVLDFGDIQAFAEGEFATRCDADGNGVVNARDRAALLTAIREGQTGYYAAYPQGHYYACDCNADGSVDMADLAAFDALIRTFDRAYSPAGEIQDQSEEELQP